jgi:hypothetical protein
MKSENIRRIKDYLSESVNFIAPRRVIYGFGVIAIASVSLGILGITNSYNSLKLKQDNESLIELNYKLSEINRNSLEELDKCIQGLENQLKKNEIKLQLKLPKKIKI